MGSLWFDCIFLGVFSYCNAVAFYCPIAYCVNWLRFQKNVPVIVIIFALVLLLTDSITRLANWRLQILWLNREIRHIEFTEKKALDGLELAFVTAKIRSRWHGKVITVSVLIVQRYSFLPGERGCNPDTNPQTSVRRGCDGSKIINPSWCVIVTRCHRAVEEPAGE